MTITRVWQSGGESGSLSEFDSIVGSPTISSADKVTGIYSLQITTNNQRGIVTVPSTRQLRIGFYFNPGSANGSNEKPVVSLLNVTQIAGINQRQTDANSPLILDFAGTDRDIVYGENTPSTWFHLGIDVKIDSSAGWGKVYKNGVEILSYSGDTGNLDIEQVAFGNIGGDSPGTQYYDDMYIDDTTGEASPTGPPIKKFYALNVNGDGTYSQWTPNTGSSHYQLVDERPPDDDTTYLEAVTGSLLDSFNMTTFTLDTNEDIIAMIPFAFAKRGSTTEKISLGTRSSGTNLIGTDQNMPVTYGYVWERQVTGSLGFEWDQSYMDSVEVIINSTGTY